MKLGIANQETWGFFNEIYADLSNRYQTSIFERRNFSLPIFNARINRYLFHKDMQNFMKQNDVAFFEWASELLMTATHLPKTCGIVTRLHRQEMYRWADKINWDPVDKVILVSKAKQREFISMFPQQASKTMVASPSTPLDKFKPKAKTFSGDIGILCHLTPRKRVYDLILDFYELDQRQEGFHLHIGGDRHDWYRDYYRALHFIVEDLKLQEKVTFYDHVSEPWTWYHKIDIFISNSFSEGLQVSPMEAMASGCYCLTHRWEGADELLPKAYQFITSSELQDKILQYSQLPEAEKQEQRERMHQIARERFDIKKTIIQVRDAIEEVYRHGR